MITFHVFPAAFPLSKKKRILDDEEEE